MTGRIAQLSAATGIRAEVLEEISAFARRYDLERVILFGSRARGDFHRASDIDLALSGGDQVRFSLDVDEETSTLLEYDFIDLAQPIDADLRQAIQREGVLLYEKV
jgi:predicted nucleotidyltransferase